MEHATGLHIKTKNGVVPLEEADIPTFTLEKGEYTWGFLIDGCTCTVTGPKAKAEEIASELVQAVNSHDELVVAATHARRALRKLLKSRGQEARIDAGLAGTVLKASLNNATKEGKS